MNSEQQKPQAAKAPEQGEHSASISERASARLTGVSEVRSYDENTVNAVCARGEVTLRGSSLKIVSFDAARGALSVEGKIDSLEYGDKAAPEGTFWSRLFG